MHDFLRIFIVVVVSVCERIGGCYYYKNSKKNNNELGRNKKLMKNSGLSQQFH